MAGAPTLAQYPGAPRARPGAMAWIALGMLCFVYVLNFLDRQLLSILAKPIQDELGVTDGQLGLMGGLYFAMFYCILAIPVGWLADRTNRVRVLAISCAVWSAATAACGMASTYPQLVLARMTVGIGEAGGVPPSYAIISDYFPPGTRGTALGLFNLGPPIGQAVGVALGASIAAAYSWRLAFISVGVIGIVTAASVWMIVREPKKGGLDVQPQADVASEPPPGFWAGCSAFFADPVLRGMALACGATQFVTYAVMNFTVLLLMREKGMTLEEVAVWYAVVVGLGTSAGMVFSGRLIDRLAKRSKTAYAYVPAAGLAIALPLFVAFVWADNWKLALAFLALPMGLNYFYLSPAVTMVQERVKPNQRVMSGALLLLVMNLIGLGLGPTYLGAASDYFRTTHPDNSLQMAFYTLIPFYLLAVGMFLMLAKTIRKQVSQEANS